MLSPDLKDFPITAYLDSICAELKKSASRALILTAETGAGKSTILPLGLLENFKGKILMTEPRRLAVLGVSHRVSALVGDEVGGTVGYRIQLDSKKSAKTRMEIVTEALLVRELQKDPALENYNVVVLDEFHERSVSMDLSLAFLKEAMELRDDLFVIVMSATIDAKKISAFFGEEKTPVIEIPGRTFPVETIYKPEASLPTLVLSELKNNTSGLEFQTILVFLPGIYEIRKYESELNEILAGDDFVEILTLHSSVSLEEQKKILKPGIKNRVILSSAIAETSLTIPGITTVIDSGLCRVNRLNIATGMENLVTEKESEFSAKQRAGRAGREREGKCYRLWGQKEILVKELAPEILRTDLSSVVLECAERGIYDLHNINWIDSPVEAAWNSSVELLKQLGCLKEDGRILEKGKAVLHFGVSPRLACIALGDGPWNEKERLLIKYGSYAKSNKETQQKFLAQIKRNLSSEKINPEENSEIKSYSSGRFCLEGFPDRLGKKTGTVEGGKTEYQFISGRKAVSEVINGPEWIVAVEVVSGASIGKIFSFEEIGEAEVGEWISGKTSVVEECFFEEGKIVKFERTYFGKIKLSEKRVNSTPEDYALAWEGEIKSKGLEALPLSNKTKAFLQRVKFYNQQKNLTEKDLQNTASQWFVPFLDGVKKLDEQIVYDALYWYLEGSVIDSEVPEVFKLPNGGRAKVKYELQSSSEDKSKLVIKPVIEIIIQRIFGCFNTPEILGMKVLLKLLSPASRPLQITEDLENFWITTWPEICKEMKGRYPKHNWDYKLYTEKD